MALAGILFVGSCSSESKSPESSANTNQKEKAGPQDNQTDTRSPTSTNHETDATTNTAANRNKANSSSKAPSAPKETLIQKPTSVNIYFAAQDEDTTANNLRYLIFYFEKAIEDDTDARSRSLDWNAPQRTYEGYQYLRLSRATANRTVVIYARTKDDTGNLSPVTKLFVEINGMPDLMDPNTLANASDYADVDEHCNIADRIMDAIKKRIVSIKGREPNLVIEIIEATDGSDMYLAPSDVLYDLDFEHWPICSDEVDKGCSEHEESKFPSCLAAKKTKGCLDQPISKGAAQCLLIDIGKWDVFNTYVKDAVLFHNAIDYPAELPASYEPRSSRDCTREDLASRVLEIFQRFELSGGFTKTVRSLNTFEITSAKDRSLLDFLDKKLPQMDAKAKQVRAEKKCAE